jgi:hypothetical protein
MSWKTFFTVEVIIDSLNSVIHFRFVGSGVGGLVISGSAETAGEGVSLMGSAGFKLAEGTAAS